jgi:chitinase
VNSPAQTTSSITIAWSGSTDNVAVSGYGVYRNGSLRGTVAASTRSVRFINLACGTTYTLGVDAFDAAGNRSAIASISAATSSCSGSDATKPTTPANLAAQVQTGPKVALSWTASTDNVGVAGYRVYRGGTEIGTSTTASYTDSSVTAGSSYTYTVRAYDAAGNLSDPSNAASATIPTPGDTTKPTTPANLAAQVQAGPTVALSWTASTDNVGVAGYRVYRGGTEIGTSTTASYTDSSVAAGSSYTYTVRAYDAAGNLSDLSNVASATIPNGGDTSPPTVPSNFRISYVTKTEISVVWDGSTDNVGVTGYGLYRNGTLRGNVASTTRAVRFVQLTCGTTYTIAVDAFDAAGNRSAKSTLTVTTLACY